jgi:hypothetical protein
MSANIVRTARQNRPGKRQSRVVENQQVSWSGQQDLKLLRPFEIASNRSDVLPKR